MRLPRRKHRQGRISIVRIAGPEIQLTLRSACNAAGISSRGLNENRGRGWGLSLLDRQQKASAQGAERKIRTQLWWVHNAAGAYGRLRRRLKLQNLLRQSQRRLQSGSTLR